MKKLLITLVCACLGLTPLSASRPAGSVLTVTSDDATLKQSSYYSSYFVVLVDRFGNEQYFELESSSINGYYSLLDVSSKDFGNSTARFYYLMDGVPYGASGQDTSAFLGDAYQNPLTEYNSITDSDFCYYTLSSGYSYLIGVIYTLNLDYEIEGYYALLTRGGPVVDPTYLRGDVDGDRAVTIADVASLIDYLLSGNVQIDLYNADVDDNGRIGINDVTELIDMMLH